MRSCRWCAATEDHDVDGPTPDVLVIGYGSELRSDDAAGRRVAEAIDARRLPGVVVRSVTQLVPELAADLGGRQRVVFVDARPADGAGIEVHHLAPNPPAEGVSTHHVDPRGLLVLADTLGVTCGEIVIVTVPATDLGLGTELSEPAIAAVAQAVDVVEDLIRGAQDPARQ